MVTNFLETLPPILSMHPVASLVSVYVFYIHDSYAKWWGDRQQLLDANFFVRCIDNSIEDRIGIMRFEEDFLREKDR